MFDGETVTVADNHRLGSQLQAVMDIMADQQFRTLEELTELVREKTGHRDTPAAVSARLRDLRKAKFGGHQVDRRMLGKGLYAYCLILKRAA